MAGLLAAAAAQASTQHVVCPPDPGRLRQFCLEFKDHGVSQKDVRSGEGTFPADVLGKLRDPRQIRAE